MLKELHLKNWKSFKEATFYIDPLTVLIGTNASGKSNVLEALEFLRRMASGEDMQSALAALRSGLEWATLKSEKQFTISVLVEAKTTDYLYSLTVEINTQAKIINESLGSNQNPQKYLLAAETNYKYSNKSRIYNLNYFKNELIDKLNNNLRKTDKENIIKQIHDVDIVINTLKNIFILEPLPINMRNYTTLSQELSNDAKNIAGVLAALPETQKTNIENILSYYAKQLPEGDISKVWAEKVGKLNSDAMLYCEEEWVNGEITLIDARSMSDGTLRFLAILTALLT